MSLAITVSAGLLLSGCSVVSTSAAELDLPAKNVDQWVMPLDQYAPLESDITNANYAENLLVDTCMTEAGFEWDVPWKDISATSETRNAAGMRLFTVALAKKWGYHAAPSSDPNRAAQLQFAKDHSQISEPTHDALLVCLGGIRKEHPILSGKTQAAFGLAGPIWEAASEDRAVLEAAAKWRACMLPAGLADLESDPKLMPSPSLLEKFGFGSGDGEDPQTPKASPEELAIATMDAECRLSSGYTQAFYDAQWDRQVKVMAENQDDLVRAAAEIAKVRADALEVITANAPSQ